jgi:exosortase/archaeosortase family protein
VSSARWAAAVRLLVLLVGIFVIFTVFQEPVRHFEAVVAAQVTEWVTGAQTIVVDSLIIVRPENQTFFVAVLTPSCSVLGAAASLFLLGTTATGNRRRRMLAVGAAISAVALGNFVRLISSLVAGALGGSSALVLFHDTVGSVLTFAYILGGYVLMLWIVLPAESVETPATIPTGAFPDVLV